MAIIQSGAGTDLLGVDGTYKAARVSLRPVDHTTGGHFRIGLQSNGMTSATVAADGTIFSVRWTSATHYMVVSRFRARYTVTTAFTAAQRLGMNLFIARSFTASDSGGLATTLAGNNQKMATDMTTTAISSAADMRISDTGVVTAGTRTLDANPICTVSGVSHDPNAGAGTGQIVAIQPILDVTTDVSRGEHPIVLAQNEGLVLRNIVVFPASGVAFLQVEMAWAEVAIADY